MLLMHFVEIIFCYKCIAKDNREDVYAKTIKTKHKQMWHGHFLPDVFQLAFLVHYQSASFASRSVSMKGLEVSEWRDLKCQNEGTWRVSMKGLEPAFLVIVRTPLGNVDSFNWVILAPSHRLLKLMCVS